MVRAKAQGRKASIQLIKGFQDPKPGLVLGLSAIQKNPRSLLAARSSFKQNVLGATDEASNSKHQKIWIQTKLWVTE